MDFEFSAPGVEAGFAEFVNNGFNAAVKISSGRGSRTQSQIFSLRNRINLRDVQPGDAERMVRHAITKFLTRVPLSPSVSHSPEDLDDTLQQWTGDLVRYPKSS